MKCLIFCSDDATSGAKAMKGIGQAHPDVQIVQHELPFEESHRKAFKSQVAQFLEIDPHLQTLNYADRLRSWLHSGAVQHCIVVVLPPQYLVEGLSTRKKDNDFVSLKWIRQQIQSAGFSSRFVLILVTTDRSITAQRARFSKDWDCILEDITETAFLTAVNCYRNGFADGSTNRGRIAIRLLDTLLLCIVVPIGAGLSTAFGKRLLDKKLMFDDFFVMLPVIGSLIGLTFLLSSLVSLFLRRNS